MMINEVDAHTRLMVFHLRAQQLRAQARDDRLARRAAGPGEPETNRVRGDPGRQTA
jgi:hypothetical protein